MSAQPLQEGRAPSCPPSVMPWRKRTSVRYGAALATALGLGSAGTLAQAAAPAPACDGMVEVRLVKPKDTRSPSEPDRDPATFPQALLRLPRAGTNAKTEEGNSRWLGTRCDPATATSILARTLDVDGWAARFGIPYHDREPEQQVGFRLLFPASLPPVDDSADRAGFAARGAWIIEQPPGTDRGSARFCLLPPAPPDQCYASWGSGMTYVTGGLIVSSRVFFSRSLWKPSLGPLVTTADLDRHFAFLRALADAAVVRMAGPSR